MKIKKQVKNGDMRTTVLETYLPNNLSLASAANDIVEAKIFNIDYFEICYDNSIREKFKTIKEFVDKYPEHNIEQIKIATSDNLTLYLNKGIEGLTIEYNIKYKEEVEMLIEELQVLQFKTYLY